MMLNKLVFLFFTCAVGGSREVDAGVETGEAVGV